MDLIKGTTETGFEFEIDRNVLEDVELSDALCMMANEEDEGQQLAGTYKFKNMLLGNAQLKKLYAYIREHHDGKCTNDLVNAELSSIMKACKDLKNS